MFEIRLPERENFRKLAISRLTKKNIAHMNNITFKKDLLGVQDDLLRFAYKLTSDREEANDLLQETSLKGERVSGDCRDRQCHHPGRKKAESVLSSGDHKLSACAGV